VVYPVACHDNSRSCNRFLTTPILTVQVVRNLHFAICTCVRKATSHYPKRQEATICIRIARVTNLAHSLKASRKCNGCQQKSGAEVDFGTPQHVSALTSRQICLRFLRILFPPRKLLGNIHQPLLPIRPVNCKRLLLLTSNWPRVSHSHS